MYQSGIPHLRNHVRDDLNKPASLKFLLLNAQSIANKIDELRCSVEDLKPNVILITESWCNDHLTDAYLTIQDYELVPELRMDRCNTYSRRSWWRPPSLHQAWYGSFAISNKRGF
jgi:hypothetical protein